jgi:hypothetical protein
MIDQVSKQHRFILHTVFEYSERKTMSTLDTWKLFERTEVLAFLTEHYDVQHTLSMDQSIEDIEMILMKDN